MEKNITDEQKETLDLLTKMSNMVSNAVWMAENTGSDVDGQIELGVWAADHFLSEIRSKQKVTK